MIVEQSNERNDQSDEDGAELNDGSTAQSDANAPVVQIAKQFFKRKKLLIECWVVIHHQLTNRWMKFLLRCSSLSAARRIFSMLILLE